MEDIKPKLEPEDTVSNVKSNILIRYDSSSSDLKPRLLPVVDVDNKTTPSLISSGSSKDDKMFSVNKHFSQLLSLSPSVVESTTRCKVSNWLNNCSKINFNVYQKAEATDRGDEGATKLSMSDAPLSPESKKKSELCSYLQLMDLKHTEKRNGTVIKNRRSTRVKNYIIMLEKKELERKLSVEGRDDDIFPPDPPATTSTKKSFEELNMSKKNLGEILDVVNLREKMKLQNIPAEVLEKQIDLDDFMVTFVDKVKVKADAKIKAKAKSKIINSNNRIRLKAKMRVLKTKKKYKKPQEENVKKKLSPRKKLRNRVLRRTRNSSLRGIKLLQLSPKKYKKRKVYKKASKNKSESESKTSESEDEKPKQADKKKVTYIPKKYKKYSKLQVNNKKDGKITTHKEKVESSAKKLKKKRGGVVDGSSGQSAAAIKDEVENVEGATSDVEKSEDDVTKKKKKPAKATDDKISIKDNKDDEEDEIVTYVHKKKKQLRPRLLKDEEKPKEPKIWVHKKQRLLKSWSEHEEKSESEISKDSRDDTRKKKDEPAETKTLAVHEHESESKALVKTKSAKKRLLKSWSEQEEDVQKKNDLIPNDQRVKTKKHRLKNSPEQEDKSETEVCNDEQILRAKSGQKQSWSEQEKSESEDHGDDAQKQKEDFESGFSSDKEHRVKAKKQRLLKSWSEQEKKSKHGDDVQKPKEDFESGFSSDKEHRVVSWPEQEKPEPEVYSTHFRFSNRKEHRVRTKSMDSSSTIRTKTSCVARKSIASKSKLPKVDATLLDFTEQKLHSLDIQCHDHSERLSVPRPLTVKTAAQRKMHPEIEIPEFKRPEIQAPEAVSFPDTEKLCKQIMEMSRFCLSSKEKCSDASVSSDEEFKGYQVVPIIENVESQTKPEFTDDDILEILSKDDWGAAAQVGTSNEEVTVPVENVSPAISEDNDTNHNIQQKKDRKTRVLLKLLNEFEALDKIIDHYSDDPIVLSETSSSSASTDDTDDVTSVSISEIEEEDDDRYKVGSNTKTKQLQMTPIVSWDNVTNQNCISSPKNDVPMSDELSKVEFVIKSPQHAKKLLMSRIDSQSGRDEVAKIIDSLGGDVKVIGSVDDEEFMMGDSSDSSEHSDSDDSDDSNGHLNDDEAQKNKITSSEHGNGNSSFCSQSSNVTIPDSTRNVGTSTLEDTLISHLDDFRKSILGNVHVKDINTEVLSNLIITNETETPVCVKSSAPTTSSKDPDAGIKKDFVSSPPDNNMKALYEIIGVPCTTNVEETSNAIETEMETVDEIPDDIIAQATIKLLDDKMSFNEHLTDDKEIELPYDKGFEMLYHKDVIMSSNDVLGSEVNITESEFDPSVFKQFEADIRFLDSATGKETCNDVVEEVVYKDVVYTETCNDVIEEVVYDDAEKQASDDIIEEVVCNESETVSSMLSAEDVKNQHDPEEAKQTFNIPTYTKPKTSNYPSRTSSDIDELPSDTDIKDMISKNVKEILSKSKKRYLLSKPNETHNKKTKLTSPEPKLRPIVIKTDKEVRYITAEELGNIKPIEIGAKPKVAVKPTKLMVVNKKVLIGNPAAADGKFTEVEVMKVPDDSCPKQRVCSMKDDLSVMIDTSNCETDVSKLESLEAEIDSAKLLTNNKEPIILVQLNNVNTSNDEQYCTNYLTAQQPVNEEQSCIKLRIDNEKPSSVKSFPDDISLLSNEDSCIKLRFDNEKLRCNSVKSFEDDCSRTSTSREDSCIKLRFDSKKPVKPVDGTGYNKRKYSDAFNANNPICHVESVKVTKRNEFMVKPPISVKQEDLPDTQDVLSAKLKYYAATVEYKKLKEEKMKLCVSKKSDEDSFMEAIRMVQLSEMQKKPAITSNIQEKWIFEPKKPRTLSTESEMLDYATTEASTEIISIPDTEEGETVTEEEAEMDFEKVDEAVELKDADLEDAELEDSELEDAELEAAELGECDLQKGELEESELEDGIMLEESVILDDSVMLEEGVILEDGLMLEEAVIIDEAIIEEDLTEQEQIVIISEKPFIPELSEEHVAEKNRCSLFKDHCYTLAPVVSDGGWPVAEMLSSEDSEDEVNVQIRKRFNRVMKRTSTGSEDSEHDEAPVAETAAKTEPTPVKLDATLVAAKRNPYPSNSLHRILVAQTRRSKKQSTDLSSEDSTIDWSTISSPRTNRTQRSSHTVTVSEGDGPILSAHYFDYNLIVTQEQTISFWTQSALGSMLEAQNMWIKRGAVQRLNLDSGCVSRLEPECCTGTESSCAYVELWTKEHKSDKRERPVADVFTVVYFWRNRQAAPEKKFLQLENINGFADDVKYVVMKNSGNILVSWRSFKDDVSSSVLHCYQLASDYQTVVAVKLMESVEHVISSLHNIEDCDTLVMGCGEYQATIWNLEHGYVVSTIDIRDGNMNVMPRTLMVRCDRGFLFMLQHCEDEGLLQLTAINGMSSSWKKLQVYKPSTEFERLRGICMDNGILVAFYANGLMCWSVQSGDVVLEEPYQDVVYYPSGKHVLAVDPDTSEDVQVRSALSFLITSYDFSDS